MSVLQPPRFARGPRRLLAVAAGLGVALALASCYPGDVTDVSQLDVVITAHDKAVNFGDYQTYALPDTVIEIVATSNPAWPISHDYDDEVVAQVRSNFEALGYAYEADSTTPPTSSSWWPPPPATPPTSTTTGGPTGAGTTPATPGWGWYYPPSIDVVSYDQGTLFIQHGGRAQSGPPTPRSCPSSGAPPSAGLLEGTASQIQEAASTRTSTGPSHQSPVPEDQLRGPDHEDDAEGGGGDAAARGRGHAPAQAQGRWYLRVRLPDVDPAVQHPGVHGQPELARRQLRGAARASSRA